MLIEDFNIPTSEEIPKRFIWSTQEEQIGCFKHLLEMRYYLDAREVANYLLKNAEDIRSVRASLCSVGYDKVHLLLYSGRMDLASGLAGIFFDLGWGSWIRAWEQERAKRSKLNNPCNLDSNLVGSLHTA